MVAPEKGLCVLTFSLGWTLIFGGLAVQQGLVDNINAHKIFWDIETETTPAFLEKATFLERVPKTYLNPDYRAELIDKVTGKKSLRQLWVCPVSTKYKRKPSVLHIMSLENW